MIDTKRLETDAAYWDEVDVTKGKATHYCTQGGGFCTPDYIRHCDIPRPTKPAAPEWDGEGLPPVGCECEANNGGDSEYFKCVVVAYHHKTGRPILETENSSLYMLTEKPDCWNIRPARTRRDMQREELKRLISDSEHYGHDHTTDTILSHYNLEPKL